MKHFLLIVVLLAVLASTAVAQDIETVMTGRAQIGAGLISEAWLQNPAVLGIQAPDNGTDRSWQHSVAGVYEIDGDVDLQSLSYGGHPTAQRWGVGAGIMDTAGMESIGLGAGFGTPDGRLAAGLNYQSVDADHHDSVDIFDFAVGGLLPDVCSVFDTGMWGVVARDVGDQFETTFDLGVGFESADWRIAADVEDFSDEVETIFQIGAARRFGAMRQWQVGAGLDDSDLTAGVNYRPTVEGAVSPWKIGVAWLEGDHGQDDSWMVGASADF